MYGRGPRGVVRPGRIGLALVRVLVIGSGAREHALLLALRRDPQVDWLGVAPGNAGTGTVADQYEVDITSGPEVVDLARRVGADLVVVGPEVPLVLGVADAVRAAGIACFGPSKDAARIEGSKAFAKDVMTAAGVQTATSEIVDNPAHLDAALDRFGIQIRAVAAAAIFDMPLLPVEPNTGMQARAQVIVDRKIACGIASQRDGRPIRIQRHASTRRGAVQLHERVGHHDVSN